MLMVPEQVTRASPISLLPLVSAIRSSWSSEDFSLTLLPAQPNLHLHFGRSSRKSALEVDFWTVPFPRRCPRRVRISPDSEISPRSVSWSFILDSIYTI